MNPERPEADRMRAARGWGIALAHSSWLMQVLGLMFLVAMSPSDDAGYERLYRIFLGIVLVGGAAAIIALLGMVKWGTKRVLVPAIVGLVLLLFFLGMRYVGQIEYDTFHH